MKQWLVFESIKPYVVWVLLVIFLGPYALSLWRGTKDVDAQVAIIEAMNQLNNARAILWDYPEAEWPEVLEALSYSRNKLTQMYTQSPSVVGVVFKDDVLIKDTLSGTQICLLYTSPSPRDLSTSRMPSSA